MVAPRPSEIWTALSVGSAWLAAMTTTPQPPSTTTAQSVVTSFTSVTSPRSTTITSATISSKLLHQPSFWESHQESAKFDESTSINDDNEALQKIAADLDEGVMQPDMFKKAIDPVHLRLIREGKFQSFMRHLRAGKYDINASDFTHRTALEHAARQKTLICMKAIMRISGADINACSIETKKRPVHATVERNFIEGLKLLLNNSTLDVNAQDIKGRTPLYYAVQKHRLEALNLLLTHPHILVDLPTFAGVTPFEHAVQTASVEFFSPLVAAGANLSRKNEDSFTPLHVALRLGVKETVRKLLHTIVEHQKAAHPESDEKNPFDVQDCDGNTPLHYAAEKSPGIIVSWLVKCGSNLNIRNAKGFLPYDIAQQRKHQHPELKDLRPLLKLPT